jgi:hypothetical protein
MWIARWLYLFLVALPPLGLMSFGKRIEMLHQYQSILIGAGCVASAVILAAMLSALLGWG